MLLSPEGASVEWKVCVLLIKGFFHDFSKRLGKGWEHIIMLILKKKKKTSNN